MKLRTEMMEIGGQMRLATFVGCGDDRDPATAKEHDVMAAHALLQAMEAEPEFPGQMPDEMWEALRNDRDALTFAFGASVRATKAEIKQRAAEILAGWRGGDRG